MRQFIPRRSILPACIQAAALSQLSRVRDVRKRHYDRMGSVAHSRMDEMLYALEHSLNAEIEKYVG